MAAVPDRLSRAVPFNPLKGFVKVPAVVCAWRDCLPANGDLRHEGAPLRQRGRASLFVDLPCDEMALLIELVVHLGMN